ncbi:GNAT family N-acetyltransferase [Alteromonas sp. CYL-A6]|uniref:GNAT family N-acetyltransferase n=1 Tax=Alteromonas nitratireducens TaxID=3390813 RepID=UPI0034B6F868
MAYSEVVDWVLAGLAPPREALHRQMLLISGDMTACVSRIEKVVNALPDDCDTGWLGFDDALPGTVVPISQYKALLGREFDVVVYNGFLPLRPSALLALAGTLRRGGRMVVLCPPLAAWPGEPATLDTHFVSYGFSLKQSTFLRRLTTILRSRVGNDIALWTHDTLTLPYCTATAATHEAVPPFATDDQYLAYQTLVPILGDAHFAVLLTAPRGRGKSALLGMVAALLTKQGHNVSLTSPLRKNCERVASHYTLACDVSDIGSHKGKLTWYAPDNPALQNASDTILMIDEAASLPLPLLKRLIAGRTRVILSTTTMGYEGSGQGFLHRFRPWLAARLPVTSLSLTSPIRYAQHDPIDRLLETALLITGTDFTAENTVQNAKLTWHMLSFSALPEPVYRQVIQLLSLAHYQTTPDDILRITDAPDAQLLIGMHDYQVVVACVINTEGGERLGKVASDIACGRRRVKGHLGAQRITLFSTHADTATLTYWRVNRIAVSPACQQQGIGTQALKKLCEFGLESRIDAILSSFGATDRLLHFWLNNGYSRLNTGLKPDKASGERSALVGYPLSHRAQDMWTELTMLGELDEYWATWDEPAFTRYLTAGLKDIAQRRLEQFAAGTRSYDQLRFAWRYFLSTYPTTEEMRALPLTTYRTLSALTNELKLSGKAQTLQQLKDWVQKSLISAQ